MPANQRLPCKIPKATEVIPSPSQVKLCGGTASMSAEMKRRMRKPRNASSSAMGTVSTAAKTRNAIQVARIAGVVPAKASGMVSWVLVFRNASMPSQIANASMPTAGPNQLNDQATAA